VSRFSRVSVKTSVLFGRPHGSKDPGGLRISRACDQQKRPDDRVTRPHAERGPGEKLFGVCSARGQAADEVLDHAIAAFLGCFGTWNFVVPCDLNAVGGIVNVKHRNALSVWC